MPPRSRASDDEPTPSTSARRTRSTAKTKTGEAKKPTTRKTTGRAATGRKTGKTGKAASKDLPTVQVIRADPLHFGEDAYTFTDPEDQKRITKSVYVPRGTVERARAAVAFLKSFEYLHPELEGQLPTSLAALFDNAVNRIVDEIEERYNDGQPLRRVYKLPVGPSRSGATRGAASRAAARETGNT